MNSSATWLLVALAALAAAAVLWLRHRRKLSEMERRLAWSEASRFELEHQVLNADQKLQALTQAVQEQQQALQSARDLAERRAALDEVLAQAPPARAPATEWPDTLPFGPPGFRYVETMPADLSSPEGPAKPR